MGTTSAAQPMVLADGRGSRRVFFADTHHRCLGSRRALPYSANRGKQSVNRMALDELKQQIPLLEYLQAHDGPGLLPIVCLQILQQRNLLFQFIERHAIHGLLASIGRIWQSAPRSQATMVGVRKKYSPRAPAVSQHHRLSSRRCAHRRRVEESGERDGSLQCGAACSTEAPAAMLSQACCRQRKLKGATGASQSGKIVKVFPQG